MTPLKQPYEARPIRFIELYQHQDWTIKLYSISVLAERVSEKHLVLVKENIGKWLENSTLYNMETYRLATLIVHEGREGCFAVLNWWIGENMIQNYAYLLPYGKNSFDCVSTNGLTMCVWEMEVMFHERNAWVQHVMQKHDKPDVESYLNAQLNTDF